MNYARSLYPLLTSWLFRHKVIVLYGPRQVGKTTTLKKLQHDYAASRKILSLNCDELDVRQALTDKNSLQLKQLIGSADMLLLDEAQRVPNIGLTLKLLIDNFPDVQIIATGSSSFELANRIKEPLTGRKIEFHLYPLSLGEISATQGLSPLDIRRLLERRILYGMYPEVVAAPSDSTEKILKLITDSYLYKDLLSFRKIQKPDVLEKLLQALALQIGSEVSFTELGNLVGIDKGTVENYVQLLEKAFIVFKLKPLHRNRRNELKKLRKIYFYDTGIRNALIRNFNPLDLRTDKGALFENFMITERIKKNSFSDFDPLTWFWQTHQKKEIDYIEESGGTMRAFEFKWKSKHVKPPKEFMNAYPGSSFAMVDSENFIDFAM